MATKRIIEVFSAGCPACDEAVSTVKSIACPSCDVQVLDMRDPAVAQRARQYGVGRVPAVVVDGELASCCTGGAVDENALRSAGVGMPRS